MPPIARSTSGPEGLASGGLLLEQYLDHCADERQPTRERLVEHGANAVPVGGHGERSTTALLRGHVRGRAVEPRGGGVAPPVAHELGHQPEIEQHDAPVRSHAHVQRLEVAMQLAGRMQRRDPLGQLTQRRTQPLEAQPGGPHVAQEVGAGHQLHREEPFVVLAEELVQGNEVRVTDVGEGAKLAFEAEQGIGRELVELLEGYGRGALPVVRLVDNAEAAGTEAALQDEAVGP
jgi:hypothetical protein